MMVATVEAKGIKTEVQRLRKLAVRAGQVGQKTAPRLYKLAQDDFAQRFASSPSVSATGQVYGGQSWPRLSEAYLRSNPRRRGGRQLIDSEELRKSFQRGKPGNVAQVNNGVVEFGSELDKAIWNNAKRPLVATTLNLIAAAEAIMQAYLETGR